MKSKKSRICYFTGVRDSHPGKLFFPRRARRQNTSKKQCLRLSISLCPKEAQATDQPSPHSTFLCLNNLEFGDKHHLRAESFSRKGEESSLWKE